MIPTLATTGETIAFGGRALGDAEPKYLNTTTTPVYTKGRYLFALNVARRAAAKEDTAIVVEGYLDCIALHQAGFTNAVAALGTAFTPEQAHELRKVAARAILCFDADPAGVEAALKSIEMLTAEGVSAWALRIPEGKDPDEFIRRNGAEAFRALLDKPIAAPVDLGVDLHLRRGDRFVAQRAERLGAVAADELVGILALRDAQRPRAHTLGGQHFDRLERRLDAGGVGGEAEDRARRDLAQLVRLLGCERGAERRDRVGEPGLVQRDAVEVARDDDRGIFLRCRAARDVEREQIAALGVDRGRRRIEVLRLRVAERAAAERDRLAGRRQRRDHQPPAVEVVEPAALAGLEQPGFRRQREVDVVAPQLADQPV